MIKLRHILPLLLGSVITATAAAAETIEYRASVIANASTGDHAPYMIGSWNRGRITGANGIWHNGEAVKHIDRNRRFSWGAGIEYLLGYGSASDYDRWNNTDQAWTNSSVRQAPARIQQLYAELKFRGVWLTAGMKNSVSGIVDGSLSSGDLVRSNNARPIPGIAAGFIDFQDIPFTNGWVQIDGEIMYGKMTDNGFRKDMFNYYDNILPLGLWYTYKRCYFRTKPSQPF
ncbi:MAG: capsule assembly Wzi family protein, partial [Muribaculaceae bacterium]|nr:capsule assembly Wzi family protein [Muribaculaceae bacterium]